MCERERLCERERGGKVEKKIFILERYVDVVEMSTLGVPPFAQSFYAAEKSFFMIRKLIILLKYL